MQEQKSDSSIDRPRSVAIACSEAEKTITQLKKITEQLQQRLCFVLKAPVPSVNEVEKSQSPQSPQSPPPCCELANWILSRTEEIEIVVTKIDDLLDRLEF